MLRLYQSEKLENLTDTLAAEYRPPASPFQPDIIVIQSQGMGRWLSLRLAEKLGIAANIRFILPAAFIWDLLREYCGDLPERSPFSTEVLCFRIMAWLGRPENLERAPRLAGYLRQGGELRRYQLAVRIADIFDQYLVYREDWVAAWEQGQTLGLDEDEAWQVLLWRDLSAGETLIHRGRLMTTLLAKLEEEARTETAFAANPPPQKYEHRLTVFGVSNLPPAFLGVLKALGATGEVAIHALNPCREYWGEIRDPNEIGRLAGERRPEDLYLEVGHPLLASLGKQGREFFDMLSDCAETCACFDEAPPRDSLLHILQADILELVNRRRLLSAPSEPEASSPDAAVLALPISPEDRSLQVHVCHSPMREVEVLRDQLLARFDADPDLGPGDVAVLTPDIEKYTPYIEAVFAEGRDAPHIPFSIADRGLAHQHPLLETFLTLLDLPDSRFAADATLAFLEPPAVRRRFGLVEDDLSLIHDWVRAVGARWGRDGVHKTELGVPATPRHTWRDGLQRLMLGYALPLELAGEALPLFGETLPYDDIEGSRAIVLGGFSDFLETLFEWADRLKDSQPPVAWVECLNGLIDRMFDPEGEDLAVLLQLRATLDTLRELVEQAGFHEPVGIKVVKRWLSDRLGQYSGAGGFLTGEVTFCAMVPMRSLPFRFIAVLGLDHDAFPRHRYPPGFDLMARHPRRGDRSRRLDDRYLFLETLLSARETLYLSYVGRSIRDNHELPPSPVLAELIEVALQSGEMAAPDPDAVELKDHLVTEHPLQPFDPAYFVGNPRLPGYSLTWLEAARRIGQGQGQPVPLFETDLPEPDAEWRRIDPESLVYFLGNPARYLLRRRLNLRLPEVDSGFEIREPFRLDFRSRDRVRNQVLDSLRHHRGGDSAERWAEAEGILPHGRFGAVLHGREQRLVEGFAPELLADLEAQRLPPMPIVFEAQGFRLEGFLAGVTAHGLSEYGFDDPRPHQIIPLWFRHLLLCLAGPEGVEKRSILRTPGKTLVFFKVEDPATELATLLKAYRSGLLRPLPFFPRTSFAYAEVLSFPPKKLASASPGEIRAYALDKARSIWAGSDFAAGERTNAYYEAVYHGTDPLEEAFEEWALALLKPILMNLNRRQESCPVPSPHNIME